MKKYILFALFAGITLFNSANVFAFATLTAPRGGDQVTFDTNVSNVEIFLNDVKIGERRNNSFTVRFKRDGVEKRLTFKKEGYQDETIVLKKSLTNTFWGNFLIGGSFGSSTDSISTKNYMEYSPDHYFVEMSKI